jgi:hypothetical protein
MGRPNQCNPCCGNVASGGPAISDCEKVICVAFIDENGFGFGGGNFQADMQTWISAYPNRLLFVLDVRPYSHMIYPPNFISWPKAFSLKLEFDKGNIYGLHEYIERDNGNLAVADYNDAWQTIKTIVNHYGGDVLQLFNSSREVAISIDNSGSMTATQVRKTVSNLQSDAINDGKIITQTIINDQEDVLCPFVQSGCNTGQASQDLLNRCNSYQSVPGSHGEGRIMV